MTYRRTKQVIIVVWLMFFALLGALRYFEVSFHDAKFIGGAAWWAVLGFMWLALRCPKCRASLFSQGPWGRKQCAKCGHALS
ncbi:MAG: hypothetical protein AB7S41_10735 [Parvibaculaceae bacterium]